MCFIHELSVNGHSSKRKKMIVIKVEYEKIRIYWKLEDLV